MTQSDSNSIYHFISTAKDVDDLLYIENYFTNRPFTQLLPKKSILTELHRIHDDILNTPVPNVGHTKGLLGIIKCMQQFSFPEEGDWIEEHESYTHLINKNIKYITNNLEAENTFNNFYEKNLDIISNAVKFHPALKTKMLINISPIIFDIGIKRKLPIHLFKKSVNCLISMVTRSEAEKRKEVMEVVYPKLSKFFDQLYTCGDFDTQLNIVEAILRYIVPDKNRKQFLSYFKHKSPELIRKFLSIRGKDFDMDCRLFLNYINKSQGEQALVVSVPCYSVLLDEMSIEKPPEHQLFWVDFNRRSRSISIWCNKNSLLTEEEQTVAEYLSTTDWLSLVITPDIVKEVLVKSADSESGLHCNFKEVIFYINNIITIKPLSNLKCSKSKCIHILFPISKDTGGLDEKVLFEIFPSKKKSYLEQGDIKDKSNEKDKTPSNEYYLENKSSKNVKINKHEGSNLLENNSGTNFSCSQRQVKKEMEVKEVKKVSVTTVIKFHQQSENRNYNPQFGCKVDQSMKSVSNEMHITSQAEKSENILSNCRLISPKMSESVDICKLNFLENKSRLRPSKMSESVGICKVNYVESNTRLRSPKISESVDICQVNYLERTSRRKEFDGGKNGVPLDQTCFGNKTHCRNASLEGETPGDGSHKCNHYGKVNHIKELIHNIESEVVPTIDKENICRETQVPCGQLNITVDSNKQESTNQNITQTPVKMNKNEVLKYMSKSTGEQFRKTVKMGEAENNHIETTDRFEECNTILRKDMTDGIEVQTSKLPLTFVPEKKATSKKPTKHYIKSSMNPLKVIIVKDDLNSQVDDGVMNECLNEVAPCKNQNKEHDVKKEINNSSRISKKDKGLDVLENVNLNKENLETCEEDSNVIVQKLRKVRRSMRLSKKTMENKGSKVIEDKNYVMEQLKQSSKSNIEQYGEENLEKINNNEKMLVHVVIDQKNKKEQKIPEVNNGIKETRETHSSDNFSVKNQNKSLTKNEVQLKDEKSKISTLRELNLCNVNPNVIEKKIHPLVEVDTDVERRDITSNISDSKKSMSFEVVSKNTDFKSDCKYQDKISRIESILEISEKGNQSFSEVETITKQSEDLLNNRKTIRRSSLEKNTTANQGLFGEKRETSEETKAQNRIEESKKLCSEINETKHKKIDSPVEELVGNLEHTNEHREQMTSLNNGELQDIDTLNANKMSENSTALPLSTVPNIHSNMNKIDSIRGYKIQKVDTANKNYKGLEKNSETAYLSRETSFINELDNNKHDYMEAMSKSNCSGKFNKNSLKQDPRSTECFKNKRDRFRKNNNVYLRQEKGETFSNSPKTSYTPVVEKEGDQNNTSKSVVFKFLSSVSKSSKATKLSTSDYTIDKKKNLPQTKVIDEINTINDNENIPVTGSSMNDFDMRESTLLMSKKKLRPSMCKTNLPQTKVIDEIKTVNDNDNIPVTGSSMNNFDMKESTLLMSKKKLRQSMCKKTSKNKIQATNTVKSGSESRRDKNLNEHFHIKQSSTRNLRKRKAVSYVFDSPKEESTFSSLKRNKDNIDSVEIKQNPIGQKVKGRKSVKRKLFTNNQEDIVSVGSASQSSSTRCHEVLKLKYPIKDKENTPKKIENKVVQDEFDLVIASSIPPLPRKVNYWEEKYRKEREASSTNPSQSVINQLSKSQKRFHSIYSDFESDNDLSFNCFKVPSSHSRRVDSIQTPSEHNNNNSYKHEEGGIGFHSSLLSSPERLRGNKSSDICPSALLSGSSSSSYGSFDKFMGNKTKKETKTERKREQILENRVQKPNAKNSKILKKMESLGKESMDVQNEITEKGKNSLVKNNSSSEEFLKLENIPQYCKRSDTIGSKKVVRKTNKLLGCNSRKGHEVTVIREESTTLTKYSKEKTLSPKYVNSGDSSTNECIQNQFEYNFERDADGCSKKVDGGASAFSSELKYVKQPEMDMREQKKHVLRKTCISNEKNLEDNINTNSDDKSNEEMNKVATSDENLIAENNVCSSSKVRKINVTNTGKVVSQVKHTIHYNSSAYMSTTPCAERNAKNSSSSSISELAEELLEEEEDKEVEDDDEAEEEENNEGSISQYYSMNSNAIMKGQFARFHNEKLKHINAFSKKTANALLNQLSEASTSFVRERSSNRTHLEDTVSDNVEKIEKEMRELDSYEEFLNRMKSEFMAVKRKQNIRDEGLQKGLSNIQGAYETFVFASEINKHFNVKDLLTYLKRSYQKYTLKDMMDKYRKLYDMGS